MLMERAVGSDRQVYLPDRRPRLAKSVAGSVAGVVALAHADHMERTGDGAIAATRAPKCVVQHGVLLPARDFEREQVGLAGGDAPAAAGAARGIYDGCPARAGAPAGS